MIETSNIAVQEARQQLEEAMDQFEMQNRIKSLESQAASSFDKSKQAIQEMEMLPNKRNNC